MPKGYKWKTTKNHKGMLGKKHRKSTKDKMSKNSSHYWKGKNQPKETTKKNRDAHIGDKNSMFGKHHTEETKKKIRNKKLGKPSGTKGKPSKNRGEKCHLWKGGITPINMAIRCSLEYKLWRSAVFERDKYTCIWCGYKGKNLCADHIKPFAFYPELRFAIDNGRTLCKNCHKTTDTFAGKCQRNHHYFNKVNTELEGK